VVWSLLLQADSEGPTLIFNEAPRAPPNYGGERVRGTRWSRYLATSTWASRPAVGSPLSMMCGATGAWVRVSQHLHTHLRKRLGAAP